MGWEVMRMMFMGTRMGLGGRTSLSMTRTVLVVMMIVVIVARSADPTLAMFAPCIYTGDDQFVGFAVKLGAKRKKGKGEKGDVKFFKSWKRDVEKVVVEARREDRLVKVVIGSVTHWWWWKVIGVKRLVVC